MDHYLPCKKVYHSLGVWYGEKAAGNKEYPMKRRIIIAILLSSIVVTEAHAGWIWTPESRRWVNPKYAAKDSPKAQMEWAQEFFEQKDYPRAAKEFLKLVQTYPRSELAPEAQYMAGLSYELADKPGDAFACYKKLVEIYPFSQRFKDAIEREFTIAEAFKSGKKLQLIGPIGVPSLDKAIEIYQHVVDNAPYGDFGVRAQFQLGECYILQSRFEEASRAFQRIIDEYPSSDLIEQAKFKVAFCARQLSLKPSYDQSATQEAITWYKDFIENHPGSDLTPQAEQNLQQLESYKIQRYLQIAQFYEKQRKLKSAALYYRRIVNADPDSQEAAVAAGKLAEFERSGIIVN
ncbi:MAG: tetratricopeptide repeat protein [Candidatus Omnitrophica bacterium]|nr:tetratricopeptide repeat protein [Candidatus Omnitrophota bacterium]